MDQDQYQNESGDEANKDENISSQTMEMKPIIFDQLQSDCYEKIGVVQSATEGRKIVVEGGAYTAEAWAIERKKNALDQLKMARKMRGIMEKAAQEAKKMGNRNEAMKIFEKHKYTMMELASLTEAVRGRYVKDRYDGYISFDKDHARKESLSHHSAQAVLGDVRKKMSWENSEELCIRERRAEQLARQKTIERNAANKGGGRVDKISNGARIEPTLPKKREASSPTSGDQIKSTSSQPNQIKSTSSQPKKARGVLAKGQKKPVQESGIKLVPKINMAIAKATTPSVPGRKSRRCHMCKEQRTDYMSCTYWHVTGNQCKKAFCLECIRTIADYDQSSSFCPACVGKCTCKSCTRNREKEKQVPLHTRPSKRRYRDEGY